MLQEVRLENEEMIIIESIILLCFVNSEASSFRLIRAQCLP